jgi:hypothetical protein
MGCNCKKQPVVTTPTPISEPVLDEIRREDFPDTPEGQLAYELKKWNGGDNEYPLIHD